MPGPARLADLTALPSIVRSRQVDMQQLLDASKAKSTASSVCLDMTISLCRFLLSSKVNQLEPFDSIDGSRSYWLLDAYHNMQLDASAVRSFSMGIRNFVLVDVFPSTS